MFYVRVFNALILVLFGLLLYFAFPVIMDWYRTQSLTEATDLIDPQWSVKTLSDENYRIKLNYSYKVDGKLFHGEELFQGEQFRNPYKAEGRIEELKKETRSVWFSSKDPYDSSVEKFFPTKKAIYLLILLFLLNYLIFSVVQYARRYTKEHKKDQIDGPPRP